MLQPVHDRQKDRATGKMETVRINPTRTYVRLGENGGPASYTWQNEEWHSAGGAETAAENVPDDVKRDIEANPVVVDIGGPAVTKVCKLCLAKQIPAKDATFNASQMEEHLLRHVEELMAAKPAAPAVPGLDG